MLFPTRIPSDFFAVQLYVISNSTFVCDYIVLY